MREKADACFGRAVTVADMMRARDGRVERQRALLARGSCVVSLTLNIAGEIKANQLLRDAFYEGMRLIDEQLARNGVHTLERVCVEAFTGFEGALAVDGEPRLVKALLCAIEDENAFGRLLDADVLCGDGQKVSRSDIGRPCRKCLLCEGDAAVCARSRAHAAPELFAYAQRVVRAYFCEKQADFVAGLAVKGLLYELVTTPKPGLVDCANSGAHKDMDVFTFSRSASVLTPYFAQCARKGMALVAEAPPALFAALRYLGQCAEADMLRETGGINTHKGAIFALGILCAAYGRLLAQGVRPDGTTLGATCAEMCQETLIKEVSALSEGAQLTTGARQCLKGGLTGARGEAAGGYRSVTRHALPVLKACLASGMSLNDAGVCALLMLMSVAEDTNVVGRSSVEKRAALMIEARKTLENLRQSPKSTNAPPPTSAAPPTREAPPMDMRIVRDMDARFIAERISPGGAADLLAITWFMHFVDTETCPAAINPA